MLADSVILDIVPCDESRDAEGGFGDAVIVPFEHDRKIETPKCEKQQRQHDAPQQQGSGGLPDEQSQQDRPQKKEKAFELLIDKRPALPMKHRRRFFEQDLLVVGIRRRRHEG